MNITEQTEQIQLSQIIQAEKDLKHYRDLCWKLQDENSILKRTCKAQAELLSTLLKE